MSKVMKNALVSWTIVILGLLFFCSAVSASEQQSQSFGDYTVHYSSFTSDVLQPNMAKAYKITRSKNRAVLTFSVVKKSLSPLGKPVKAKVSVKANNLTGQLKNIKVREISEDSAIYYLSEFHVSHEEMLDFELIVTPEGEARAHSIKFRQKYYTQ